MKLFWKAKGFMLGKDEIEIITGQITITLSRKSLSSLQELEPFFKGLSSFEKLRIIEHLKKEKTLILKKTCSNTKKAKVLKLFSQQQMLNALIKPELVDTKPSYIKLAQSFTRD